MQTTINGFTAIGLPESDTNTISEKSFNDAALYCIEIPSTETPEAFQLALDEAKRIEYPFHRISQGSGIQMLCD